MRWPPEAVMHCGVGQSQVTVLPDPSSTDAWFSTPLEHWSTLVQGDVRQGIRD